MRNQWLRRRVLLCQPSQPPNVTAGQLALLHSVQQLAEDSQAIGESGSLAAYSVSLTTFARSSIPYRYSALLAETSRELLAMGTP